MKTRPVSRAKITSVMQKYRMDNHQETRYYCDLCHGEVGEAEGRDLPDGRFVHKRHKIPVQVEISASGFWERLKAKLGI